MSTRTGSFEYPGGGSTVFTMTIDDAAGTVTDVDVVNGSPRIFRVTFGAKVIDIPAGQSISTAIPIGQRPVLVDGNITKSNGSQKAVKNIAYTAGFL